MFDPEAKKAELEKKRKQATDRIRLPPLTGNHAENPETVPISDLLDRDTAWLIQFEASEAIRNKHGVKTVNGKWKVQDQALFNRTVSEDKKALLRPVWKEVNRERDTTDSETEGTNV